jgi:hypothetical protein
MFTSHNSVLIGPCTSRSGRHLAGRILLIVFCGLFALFPGVSSLHAQGNAAVGGVVSDTSKAVVAGAAVMLTNLGTGLQQQGASDSGGRYNFSGLQVGSYRIDVTSSGFKKVFQNGVTLTAEQALTVNFTFEVGQVSDTVEVSGDRTTHYAIGAESNLLNLRRRLENGRAGRWRSIQIWRNNQRTTSR